MIYCKQLGNPHKETQAFGEAWLAQFYIDNGISPEEQEDDEAGFDIFCEEVADEEDMEQFDPMRDGWVGKDGRP